MTVIAEAAAPVVVAPAAASAAPAAVVAAPINNAERELVAQAEYILTEAIKSNEVSLNSAMAIVAKGMEVTSRFKYLDGSHKKKLLLEVLTRIAAGADGVLGTADDLLPASTMATLKMLLEGDVVEQTINLISDVAKGKFNLSAAMATGQAVADIVVQMAPAKWRAMCPCLGGAAAATVAPAPARI